MLFLLVLLMLNRSPGVHSAGCWLSLLHLLWTPIHQGFPRVPLGRVWLSLPHLVSNWPGPPTPSDLQLNWSSDSTGNCSIRRPYITFKLPRRDMDTPPQFLPISGDRDVSLPLSLEWPVWSSSSGNNCHAVHRSLSSGASVYERTMGIFLARPISSANFRPRNFLSQLPLECVTSFGCITLEWHFWPGQNTTFDGEVPVMLGLGECGAALHCHCSQVHSGSAW